MQSGKWYNVLNGTFVSFSGPLVAVLYPIPTPCPQATNLEIATGELRSSRDGQKGTNLFLSSGGTLPPRGEKAGTDLEASGPKSPSSVNSNSWPLSPAEPKIPAMSQVGRPGAHCEGVACSYRSPKWYLDPQNHFKSCNMRILGAINITNMFE